MVNNVQHLIKKLSYEVPAAKLRRLTPLSAVQCNLASGSSTDVMLTRLKNLAGIIPQVDDKAVQELVPLDAEKKYIDNLCEKMLYLESILTKLQASNTSLSDLRLLVDAVVYPNPPIEAPIVPNVQIVKNPSFESTPHCMKN